MGIKKKWQFHNPDEASVASVATALGLSTLAAKILVSRGYDTAEKATQFLRVDDAVIHDPYLLHDMEGAIARIKLAIEEQQHIVVYGDYDAGATRF